MPDALDIFVFVCWFAGGFVSGVSGIGGTMFAFPFLALAIPMHALIPLSCLVCFFKDACMIAMHVRFCRFDAMSWLLLGAVTLLYGVLVAWLLILAVYYTVRLM